MWWFLAHFVMPRTHSVSNGSLVFPLFQRKKNIHQSPVLKPSSRDLIPDLHRLLSSWFSRAFKSNWSKGSLWPQRKRSLSDWNPQFLKLVEIKFMRFFDASRYSLDPAHCGCKVGILIDVPGEGSVCFPVYFGSDDDEAILQKEPNFSFCKISISWCLTRSFLVN